MRLTLGGGDSAVPAASQGTGDEQKQTRCFPTQLEPSSFIETSQSTTSKFTILRLVIASGRMQGES